MNSGVSINAAQRLFVIPSGGGYSCFGFENCFAHAKQLSQLLHRPDLEPLEADIGTIKQYGGYMHLTQLAGRANLGTYFMPGTPNNVRRILENYRLSHSQIRIFLGDTETGRDWLEEYDVLGHIGRSTGWLKCPLLIKARACAGPAILTACIVRLLDVKTRRELYRHPAYHQPQLSIEAIGQGPYKASVLVNSKLHARFKNEAAAARWVAFMCGDSMRK